eukprot:6864322-Ditylum_brightwellii.AAC.1
MITEHTAAVIIQTHFWLFHQQHTLQDNDDDDVEFCNYNDNHCRRHYHHEEEAQQLDEIMSMLMIDHHNAIETITQISILLTSTGDIVWPRHGPDPTVHYPLLDSLDENGTTNLDELLIQQTKIVTTKNKIDTYIICLLEIVNNGFVSSIMAGVQEFMAKQMELQRNDKKKQSYYTSAYDRRIFDPGGGHYIPHTISAAATTTLQFCTINS